MPKRMTARWRKNDLYERLQAILNTLLERDVTILIGDFNAKIGTENVGYEEVMGTHGLGEMSDNGEKSADLCANSKFVIGGSIFAHKRTHKVTWVSPDHITENQIDHICVNQKFRRSLQDVRVRRGADVGSDHQLLIGKIKLNLRKSWNKSETRKNTFNTVLLGDKRAQSEFKITLSNKYQALQELSEEETLDCHWERTKDIITSTCEKVLGQKKRQHKAWISAESLGKIEER